jgi:hypothetical protein
MIFFFFERVCMKFWIQRSIILDADTRFLSAFWTTLWEKMENKMKRYTTFHKQIDG